MKVFLVIICSLLFISTTLSAQSTTGDTTIAKELTEVVVTATRTERQLSSLPVAATIISQKQIRSMGSLRLGDVLQEQTGLAIVTDHGQGVQVQGFSPDYTLILIDGEPLVGRTAGTLQLSRVAIGNIKQIEIVKGPSSSLYGSEALAGVINIITETPNGNKGSIRARYGNNGNADISGDWSLKKNKWGVYAFVNRYSSNGYDLAPAVFGKTLDPFSAYTFNSRISYDLTAKMRFTLAGRYYSEDQEGPFSYDNDIINTNGQVRDWNLTPAVHYRFSDQVKLQARWYTSRYKTRSNSVYEKNDSLFDETFFIQSFNRPEILLEYALNEKQHLTAGAGYILETVQATRYTDKKQLSTWYGLINYEYNPHRRLGIIAGARFDRQSVYGSQFSPKLSAKYNLAKWVMLRGSVGTGFKAPDFRQLYLNFTNAAAGYSVYGTEELAAGIAALQEQGQIDEILIDPGSIGVIKAERSVAFNAGAAFNVLKEKIKGTINIFRNNITDLIETQGVARKTNGQLVYSYRNISKVFTQGIETEWSYQPVGAITLSLGYQYLDAKDVAAWDNIKSGKVYRRDPVTQVTTRVHKNDYGGLFNRSRHSGNVKLYYENIRHGFSIYLRGIYRGRYGVVDKNNNLVLDADSEYVDGYTQWNIACTKNFGKALSVQAGLDNVFNFRNTTYMPGIAGRMWFASVSYSFTKNTSK